MFSLTKFITFALAIYTAYAGCEDEMTNAADLSDVVTAALQDAGVVAALQDDNTFLTIFAPINGVDLSEANVRQHVVASDIGDITAFDGVKTFTTFFGKNLHIFPEDAASAYVNDNMFDIPGEVCANGGGIIYRINGTVKVLDSIAEVAIATPNVSAVTSLVAAAGLVPALNDSTAQLTLFAPINDGFGLLPASAASTLIMYKDTLTKLLTYHVVPTILRSMDLEQDNNASSLEGGNIRATIANGEVYFNWMAGKVNLPVPGLMAEAAGVAFDIYCDNGIVHLIAPSLPAAAPGIIIPPSYNLNDWVITIGASTLAGAVNATAAKAILEGNAKKTLFAPQDAGFVNNSMWTDALKNWTLTELLTFHLVDGEIPSSAIADEVTLDTNLAGKKMRINTCGGAVTTFNGAPLFVYATLPFIDFKASNGILHALAKPMIPVLYGNIVDTAIGAKFATLVLAVQTAKLEATLSNDSMPLTVFAPTDDAFAAVDAATLARLLADEQALTTVLTAHVVAGTVYSACLAASPEVTTLNGEKLTFANGMIGGANVVATDISATNGVVHVIDKVIIPSNLRFVTSEPMASGAMASDMASGAMASGAMASGAMASDMASGAMASGAMASGAMASGDMASGPSAGSGAAMASASANPTPSGGAAVDPSNDSAANSRRISF